MNDETYVSAISANLLYYLYNLNNSIFLVHGENGLI